MIAYVEGARSRFTPILHLSGTSVILNCYMSFQNDQVCTCICTSVWGAVSNICCNCSKCEKCILL